MDSEAKRLQADLDAERVVRMSSAMRDLRDVAAEVGSDMVGSRDAEMAVDRLLIGKHGLTPAERNLVVGVVEAEQVKGRQSSREADTANAGLDAAEAVDNVGEATAWIYSVAGSDDPIGALKAVGAIADPTGTLMDAATDQGMDMLREGAVKAAWPKPGASREERLEFSERLAKKLQAAGAFELRDHELEDELLAKRRKARDASPGHRPT